MVKAFRALMVGMMLAVMLAACGANTTTQGTTATAGGVTAAVATVAPVSTTAAPASTTAAAEATTAAPVATTAGAMMATSAPEETSSAATTSTSASTTTTAAGTTTGTTATSGTGSTGAVTLPEVDAASVTGNIITAGSSTVFPLTQRMAERFEGEGYTGDITVDSIGSGAGIERFCVAAETDIANSSRAIEPEEVEQCKAKGREVVEFRVGTDALSIVVSSENTFATNLTLAQLTSIYSGEYKTWNQVDPSFPNEAIRLYSPGTDSGTYDYFVEEVLDDDPAKLQAANPQQSEDDNVLVQGVESSPYAIGYFGYAYYNENKNRLKALSLDGVAPTEETAENGEYPLSRPLYIYSAKNILTEKPQVAAFVNFYLTNVNNEIVDVGYFPASADALNEARQSLLDATQ